MTCVKCNNKLKPKAVLRGYTLCYSCDFLEKHGTEKWVENNSRLLTARRNRHRRKRSRKFTCEMGYGDCEARGFCNGDC